MQYQAGYILESVRSILKDHAIKHMKEPALNGLLRSLCTFNVQSSLNLGTPNQIPSILAVAVNIVTRGLPTLGSIDLEQYFADTIQLTTRKDDHERGEIRFPLINDKFTTAESDELYKLLHTIEPRAKDRLKYLDVSDVDGNFESSFLLHYIPENFGYLTQILEKQRSRSSFTRDNNPGRVDFSFEIPYDIVRERNNRYNKLVQTRHHKIYVVEVDGMLYHTKLVDELKDFEIAQFSTTIKHINEDNIYGDVQSLIGSILAEDYVKYTKENFNDSAYLENPLTALSLSPFGIARLQRIFLQYLMVNYEVISRLIIIKIAIIERDFPCGYAAFDDLFDLIGRLNQLSENKIYIPIFDVTVFTTKEFLNHPLHCGKPVKLIECINHTSYDLVFDISLLRRNNVFNEDKDILNNSIVIRNAHYIHYKTNVGVFSAPPIKYCSIVEPPQNEIYKRIEVTSTLLRKLLQDIFRKLDFRDGQLPILDRAIQQKSVIGLLPTGGGKSLTYQLAAMLQPGMTIVIDPIRSLMLDQYNGLKEIGIDKCEFINSTLSAVEKDYNQNKLLANGKLQFIFVSPERFVIAGFRNALEKALAADHCFAYAIIDEVHCVSEWGHDFRTPYLNLGSNAQEYCKDHNDKPVPLFGLTATASFDVLADIERELRIKEDDGNAVVRFENCVRDEINYLVQDVNNSFEEVDILTERTVTESVGNKKQNAVFELIRNKNKVINTFNNQLAINDITEHSFNNYLQSSLRQELIYKYGSEKDALNKYSKELFERLNIASDPFKITSNLNKIFYNYGIIVFMPHRMGCLGIHGNLNSHGLFDHPDYVERVKSDNNIKHKFDEETLGYFMGSSDDDNAEKVEIESFHHFKMFKDNEESIMVATKAFGMGIDKPNVRMTIHINIPQSIESFVQESGRAGRDGKISVSVILFNKDLLNLKNRKEDDYHLDKEVLMFFHKNSFKGQLKERVMIYELRNWITYPNISRLQKLTDDINDCYGTDDIQFKLKLGHGKNYNRVFINTLTDISIGYVYLDTYNTGIYHDYGNDTICNDLVRWLKERILTENIHNVEVIRGRLQQMLVNTEKSMGLERILTDMNKGETNDLLVPFTNRFYSKKGRRNEFLLNDEHFKKVLNTSAIQELINSGELALDKLFILLKNAVFDGSDYPEFIKSLNINNKSLIDKLLENDHPKSIELQRSYFIPRSQEDTAKAIYRLLSIGIIDSYTIDYQNKLYNITFTNKYDDEYYNSLEELIARYTSKNIAKKEIEKLKAKVIDVIEPRGPTVISSCLEYLTGFIYGKIKEKRLQAIDDMVRLCQTSINIKDSLLQNEFIKDEIYYYFNAKYSRVGFKERIRNHEFNASLPDDLDNELSIEDSVEKYIGLDGLVMNVETGELLSNIKHLRGSAMRMLRSYPEKPQYRILKSFSLFVLADSIIDLINEAKLELIKGLINWKQNEDHTLDVQEYIIRFKKRVAIHVMKYNVEQAFDDIEDHYFALYYTTWTINFNKQLSLQEL
jgi:ATP-dependent DNA helicase RecQ